MIKQIMAAVSIPVMAKCRIGHFVEAQILEHIGACRRPGVASADTPPWFPGPEAVARRAGADYIDESEVLTPAGAPAAHRTRCHALRAAVEAVPVIHTPATTPPHSRPPATCRRGAAHQQAQVQGVTLTQPRILCASSDAEPHIRFRQPPYRP